MAELTFQPDEGIAEGARRLMIEAIDVAIVELSGVGSSDPVEAVHEARKSLKRARAVARLVRDDFPGYRLTNVLCRDASRQLSTLRDASALIESLDMVRHRLFADQPSPSVDRIQTVLVQRRDAMHADAAREIEAALRIAREARAHVVSAEFDAIDIDTLIPGLARPYRRGLRMLRLGQLAGETELLHEWRKRVKYHRYQVGFIQNAWPGPMAARERALKELAELLGDDHDLAVLGEMLPGLAVDNPALVTDTSDVAERAKPVRRSLQAEALQLGARCFVERSRPLARRLVSYVCVWRSETPA